VPPGAGLSGRGVHENNGRGAPAAARGCWQGHCYGRGIQEERIMKSTDCIAAPIRRSALAGIALAAGLAVACGDIPEETAGESARVERAEGASREAPAAGGAQDENACAGLDVDRPVLLSWEGLAGGAPLRGGVPVLAITSRAREAIAAQISARFFTDQGVVRVDLGRAALRAGGAVRVAVPLDPPGVALGRLEFAAQVLVDVELWQGDRRLVSDSADSLFFHQDPATGEVLAYGEVDHRSAFGAGDFRGLRPRGAGEVAISGIGRAREARPEELTGDPEDRR
jgi:hypothetical protein